jgi:hypothetical protein
MGQLLPPSGAVEHALGVVQPALPATSRRRNSTMSHHRRSSTRNSHSNVETWAATAFSGPMSNNNEKGRIMPTHDSQPETEQTTAHNRFTDRAVQAGERLMEATSQVGDAYADAYQEAVVNMADFRENLASARPPEWSKLMQGPGAVGTPPLGMPPFPGKPMLDAAGTASRVNRQLVAARKRLGLAYVEACEQAVLSIVELREQAANASGSELLRTLGTKRTDAARDIAKSYGDVYRQLFT